MQGSGSVVRKWLGILHKKAAIPAPNTAKYANAFKRDLALSNPTLPLGQETRYPTQYEPGVLFAIPRSESRSALNVATLPFHGVDIWNAWELTWLDAKGMPQIATAEIRVPADTPNLIESKSLKLYLNSFAMMPHTSRDCVRDLIVKDLSRSAGGTVTVILSGHDDATASTIRSLPGGCLDRLDVSLDTFAVDANLLRADPADITEESLHTHLLRSLCPVTAQPDIGSLSVRYKGPRIDPEALLRYVVSYRQHNDFHEACIERMFIDIQQQCGTESLSVYARYQRRGGLDINPFRSNFEYEPENLRLWRQ